MKVLIDPGHGGQDSGARFRGHKESDLALSISIRLASMLSRANSIETKLTRETDHFIRLRDRAHMANTWGADLFLSVHLNADMDADNPGDSEARGYEFWHYRGSRNGMKFARRLGVAFGEEFPDEPYRGEKSSAGLFVLRQTRMTAALAEVAFIDNSKSVREVNQPETQDAIAFALMKGVIDAVRENL
mgnify:CR=1 FL=1